MMSIAAIVFCVIVLGMIGLGLAIFGLPRHLIKRAGRNTIQQKITQINRDFPDEVRALGGAQALKDPRIVQAIIARLEQE